MRSKVPSDWLPSYIKVTRPVLEIFKMAGYFPDSLRTMSKGGWARETFRTRWKEKKFVPLSGTERPFFGCPARSLVYCLRYTGAHFI